MLLKIIAKLLKTTYCNAFMPLLNFALKGHLHHLSIYLRRCFVWVIDVFIVQNYVLQIAATLDGLLGCS